MSSTLTGLFRVLNWPDFKGAVPGSTHMEALTDSGFTPSGLRTEPVGSGSSRAWRLADSVTVDITFNETASWVKPSAKTAALLDHERGHYKISALLARDMFIELMQLKNVRLPTSNDVSRQASAIFQRYRDVAQKVQNVYDSAAQTNHHRNTVKQNEWNGFFDTAFTTARVPAVHAPDGKLYKVELLDVLANNNISI